MYQYRAELIRVVDADTYDFQLDLGFNITVQYRFRLQGIDCPETWRPKTDAERKHGEAATKFVIDELTNANEIIVISYKLGVYNRYECSVIYDGKTLLQQLIRNDFKKLKDYTGTIWETN